jgi:diaminohydroxyphosphoribosylaminopyrimidine deaminase/5-amino-6-(5-phosphoribosylamino)uracil reductase
MAPTLLGSGARALLELPFEKMREQQRLHINAIRAVGNDWRIDATPLYAAED